jgi:SAM-dependent methyltransferase
VEKGGPEEKDYADFTEIVNHLKESDVNPFREIIKDALNENTLIGHGFVKPYGYPGDFRIIHSIYKDYVNPDPRYSRWDRFFQDQAGANAVRNRKQYFLDQCEKFDTSGKKDVKILVLGSGPATDVNEYLSKHPDTNIEFNLIDFDQNAIDFAKKQNLRFDGAVKYFRINVLRFKPIHMYDLIWSAGLFDYFREKHFAYMINKYYKFLADGGEFVIGNFSLQNPTRRLMEVLSDWYLHHRSRYELIDIARDAGVKEKNIKIDQEDLGVNLFLHIK